MPRIDALARCSNRIKAEVSSQLEKILSYLALQIMLPAPHLCDGRTFDCSERHRCWFHCCSADRQHQKALWLPMFRQGMRAVTHVFDGNSFIKKIIEYAEWRSSDRRWTWDSFVCSWRDFSWNETIKLEHGSHSVKVYHNRKRISRYGRTFGTRL